MKQFASVCKRNAFRIATIGAAIVAPLAARADDPPALPNYGTFAGTLYTSLVPLIGAVMPTAVLLMALFMGPKIFQSLVKRFSK